MRKVFLTVASLLLGVMSLEAAGTAAGTDITNSVNLSYKVSGTSQTDVTANDGTGFKVDRKIDIYVDATNTPLSVASGAREQNLTFVVRNDGNDADDFNLTGKWDVAGDQFNPTDCNVTKTDGTLINNTNNDNDPRHITLAADENITVHVTCDIPSGLSDGDDGTIYLYATTKYTDNSGDADIQGTVQNVFADGTGVDDGNYDGVFSDSGTYHISGADLTASKDSCVIDSRAFNNTNPKRIPGATIRYYIQVNDTGSADADDVTTTDTLKAQLTYVRSGIEPGACDCANWDGTSDAGSTSHAAGSQDVGLDFGTISAGQSECAYIDATIN